MAEESTPSRVSVAYGEPDRQSIVELPWSPELTAGDAVRQSGLLERVSGIDATHLVLGVFGERVDGAHTLGPGDRVEICRPLRLDPRDMRRAVLSAGGVMGQAKGTAPHDDG